MVRDGRQPGSESYNIRIEGEVQSIKRGNSDPDSDIFSLREIGD